jgi:hypothetical protein
MQDKHIDELKKKIYAILHDNIVLGVDEGQAYLKYTDEAEDSIITLITTEQLAILEGLKRESRELVKFNKTEPLNVGEIQNVELIRAIPIEAIQQQIDKIGGKE